MTGVANFLKAYLSLIYEGVLGPFLGLIFYKNRRSRQVLVSEFAFLKKFSNQICGIFENCVTFSCPELYVFWRLDLLNLNFDRKKPFNFFFAKS